MVAARMMDTMLYSGKTLWKTVTRSNLKEDHVPTQPSSRGSGWKSSECSVFWLLLSVFGNVLWKRYEFRKELAGLQAEMKGIKSGEILGIEMLG